MIGKLFKLVLLVVVAAFVGLVGFAYLGDLSPVQIETRQAVTLDVN